MTSDAALLVARDVSVVLDEQSLLSPTSLELHVGRALAIRGPNGAGKTTLLRVLAGISTPTDGTVLLSGEPFTPRKPAHRRAVAGMIGAPPVARDLTVFEQLRFVRATWGDSAKDGELAAQHSLEELGIEHLGERYATELSSGQSQLFALALTLSRPCSVLLLDEPEQRLDADRRALVADAIRRRLDAGIAVAFATHNAALVAAIQAEVLTVGEST